MKIYSVIFGLVINNFYKREKLNLPFSNSELQQKKSGIPNQDTYRLTSIKFTYFSRALVLNRISTYSTRFPLD